MKTSGKVQVGVRSPVTSYGTVVEAARKVPVVDEVDLVVVGGSCTGLFAAVRAARLGLRVALVEQHNCFGGVATAGGVNIWHSVYDTVAERQIIGGLTLEVVERLKRRDAVITSDNPVSFFTLNTEELKIELDELVVEHAIRPYLHTLYVAPLLQEGRLDGVIIENKSGRQAIRGREFIDATGDGTLALDLGLDSWRPDDLQPPTLCAKIAGFARLHESGCDWNHILREHGAEFGLAGLWGWGAAIPGLHDTQMRADSRILDGDMADATQLSLAEIEGRRQIRAMLDLLRKYGPADARLGLVDIAATIGARETRRIAAQYRITGDDVLYGRPFADAIANGSYRVDIHHANGPGITFRYLDGSEVVVPARGAKAITGRWREPLAQNPTYYQIPWRSLVAKGVPNLALAGRMLDADKTAFSALRVMVNMNQTGEAAGVAAALALQEGCAISEVDPARLRKSLAAGGSVII